MIDYKFLQIGLQKSDIYSQMDLIQKDLTNREMTQETLQRIERLQQMMDELTNLEMKASKCINYRYLIKNLRSSP
jgi:hypothetical protein